MKKFVSIFILCFTIISIQAQKTSNEPMIDYSDRVKTLDSTLETFYAVISGEKGAKRNWTLFKYLFQPNAKLIPSGKNSEGFHLVSYLSPADYIKKSEAWLKEQGFFEKEISRTINTFGNIAHVFSTYEAYYSHTDEEPFMRGIHSFQLVNDEERWWIVNVFWNLETPDSPIPNVYLPKEQTNTYSSY
ncbi:hypothetical protein APS56_00805 [Pseudalgibacter alginicilyticus]|uniref:SnoaL-like domain-containing protein n=1 Tax=Pseudalgibacter alginicilyticus TaxID=1736674 RepID=A0A0P0CD38_9FLAO|nr:hypothetical protein [Pseudalgibacter alginicilyticus]ALJ03776.1 hypothetical protein APS56_00805 [Pseudalgibacter alginicilyticus]